MERRDSEMSDIFEEFRRGFRREAASTSFTTLQALLQNVQSLSHELAHHINDSSPIAQLPQELLLHVFKLILTDAHRFMLSVAPGRCLQHHSMFRQLVQLTYVCRRWRDIVRACPHLWNVLDGRSLESAAALAARASLLPLSLVLTDERTWDDSDSRRFNRLLNLYGSRLTRVDLAFGVVGDEYADAPMILSSHRLQQLQCLAITGHFKRTANFLPRSDMSLLDDHSSQQLRALAISPVSTWLPSDTFMALTHLYLSFPPQAFRLRSNLSTVLSLFERCPMLEVVQISKLELLEGDWAADQPLPLDRLRYLSLTHPQDLADAFALLRHLCIPAGACVYIGTTNIAPDLMEPGPIIPRLAAMETLSRIELSTNTRHLHLLAQNASNTSICLHSVDIDLDQNDPFAAWILYLPAMFTLSTVTSLRLRLDNTGSTIVTILECASALESLELSHSLFLDRCSPNPIEGAILHTIWRLRGSNEQPMICPLLRDITLVIECVLGRPWVSRRECLMQYTGEVLDMARQRQRIGRPLRRLAFQPARPQVTEDDPDVFLAMRAEYGTAFDGVVENFVLHRPEEEDVIRFSSPETIWDMGEIEKYWTLADDDLPRFAKGTDPETDSEEEDEEEEEEDEENEEDEEDEKEEEDEEEEGDCDD